jgi:hypothetical protein
MSRWSPTSSGDLFIMAMPNGSKVLMRVTSIEDGRHWTAEQASIDDAVAQTGELPVLDSAGNLVTTV